MIQTSPGSSGRTDPVLSEAKDGAGFEAALSGAGALYGALAGALSGALAGALSGALSGALAGSLAAALADGPAAGADALGLEPAAADAESSVCTFCDAEGSPGKGPPASAGPMDMAPTATAKDTTAITWRRMEGGVMTTGRDLVRRRRWPETGLQISLELRDSRDI